MMVESCSVVSDGTSSSRYRRVSQGSNIDDSLFGHRNPPQKSSTHVNHDSSVVKKSDFNRMKGCSSSSTKIIDDDTTIKGEMKCSVPKHVQARKKHMINLEHNSKHVQNMASQKLREKEKVVLLQVAQQKIDESEDVVKLLNTYQQRAAAFAIRDEQLMDKATKEKEERDYERLMDISMEMNRLQELAAREKAEESKIRKRIADRKVIEDQIKERAHQKLLEEEARDQENRQMLETIKTLQEKDTAKTVEQRENIKKSQEELIKWNEAILREKTKRKELEKDEEERILAYQAQREDALRKREESENESRRQKIQVQRKLLEQHEKSMDKQSQLDELRARRAAEETERKYRQKELLDAQKRKNDMQVLHEARKRQENERRQLHEKKKMEKIEDFNNAMAFASDMARREKAESDKVKKKNAELRAMLQQQIEENEVKLQLREKEKYEEGRQRNERMALEKIKLEAIRDKMVNELKGKGVKDKYISEMTALDIQKMLMK